MGTCATCRHWDRDCMQFYTHLFPAGQVRGACSEISTAGKDGDNQPAVMCNDGDGTHLMTLPTFGCVLYSPKET